MMIVAASEQSPFGLRRRPRSCVGFLIWLLRTRSPMVTRECPHCKKRLRGDATSVRIASASRLPGFEHEGRWWRQDTAGVWEHRKLDALAAWMKPRRATVRGNRDRCSPLVAVQRAALRGRSCFPCKSP